MRKLAWLLLILLLVFVVIGTLAAVDYGGVGTWLFNSAEGTFAMPIRGFIIDNWIAVGNSGIAWIVLSSFIQGLVWTGLIVFIIYGLFWQKLIQQKILHKQAQKTLTTTREEPRDIIVAQNPEPIKTKLEEPKKEEVTVEPTS